MKGRWGRTFGNCGSGLCHRERWADEFHAIRAVNFRIVGIIAAIEVLCIVSKESFHLVGGSEGDENFAGSVTGEGPGVRNFARRENRIAGFQMEAVRADFQDVLSFDGVKPFIFVVVQVARRAAFFVSGVLEEKESAAAVLRGDFEIGGADADVVVLAVAVFAVGNESGLPRRRGSLDGLRQGRKWKGGECGANKRAAIQIAHFFLNSCEWPTIQAVAEGFERAEV